jgi:hypothetical protein
VTAPSTKYKKPDTNEHQYVLGLSTIIHSLHDVLGVKKKPLVIVSAFWYHGKKVEESMSIDV